jgi:tryptophan-rich sensory protein
MMLIPNDAPVSHSVGLSATLRRSPGSELSSQIVAGLAVLLALLLVWQGVAAALDSPLLGIVAVGMLFLIGVATTGAVNQGRC